MATSSILATPVKSIPVISLATQSIVIWNAQSVTAARVATTLVADVHPVRYAGVYAWLCLTTILSSAGVLLR